MLDLVSEAWRQPLLLALSLPVWLYEFAVVGATVLGAAFSATAQKLLQVADRSAATRNGDSIEGDATTRHQAHLAIVAVACAVTVFLAGYFARNSFVSENILGFIRIVAIFIGIVGGSFFFDKSKTIGLAVFKSPLAVLLILVSAFDFWYEHRSANGSPEPSPSPVATRFETPEPAGTGPSNGAPSTPQTSTPEGRSSDSPSSDEFNSPVPTVTPEKRTAMPESPVARVKRGMDSGDPGTRLKTLTEAVQSGDRYLRNFALSKAFAGSDSALRSEALRDALEMSSSFIITIEGALPKGDPISEGIGRSFQIDIQDAGSTSARLRVSSSISNTTGSIVVAGQNVSFNIPADKLFNSGDSCSGDETLLPRRSVLKGKMHCKNDQGLLGSFVGNYDIVTNVLP